MRLLLVFLTSLLVGQSISIGVGLLVGVDRFRQRAARAEIRDPDGNGIELRQWIGVRR